LDARTTRKGYRTYAAMITTLLPQYTVYSVCGISDMMVMCTVAVVL
jgi:ribonucleotide reductase alpha subunit